MHSEQNRRYEQALTLAESGRYGQALEQMLDYLQTSPSDGKALNDAGTILFCMQRGIEAIAYFEKALTVCRGDELTQVYWNLCEAYIQEAMPQRAFELFGPMRDRGILNADLLNRTAEIFLQQNTLGGAVETLLTSLDLSPDQEVLKPMLEVIRSHRIRVTIAADRRNPLVCSLQSTLERRLPVETLIDASAEALTDKMRQPGAVIFAGAGHVLSVGLDLPKNGKAFVVLEEGDLYHPSVTQVRWSAADAILACASAEAVSEFKERTGARAVSSARAVTDPQSHLLYEKKAGKRIAAVGPWTLRHNPMFLLQCFQKLHYLDADTRLYLAGEFEDAGLERYVKSMAETMDLDSVIFFDGPVSNLNKWFRDKHFIVSTAIDSSAMAGVWAGMACGLKPVVHGFAEARSMMAHEHVFTLAEEFCTQIQSGRFEPVVYRRLVQEQFEKHSAAGKLHSMIYRMEQANLQAPSARPEKTQAVASAAVPEWIGAVPAAGQAVAPSPSINKLAEQALSVSRSLKDRLQESHSAANAQIPAVPLHSQQQPSEPRQSLSPAFPQGGLSVESFLETERAAIPFAART